MRPDPYKQKKSRRYQLTHKNKIAPKNEKEDKRDQNIKENSPENNNSNNNNNNENINDDTNNNLNSRPKYRNKKANKTYIDEGLISKIFFFLLLLHIIP